MELPTKPELSKSSQLLLKKGIDGTRWRRAARLSAGWPQRMLDVL
jgi:hypothetical protein